MENVKEEIVERVYNKMKMNEELGYELRNNPSALSLFLKVSYGSVKYGIFTLLKQGRIIDTGYYYSTKTDRSISHK